MSFLQPMLLAALPLVALPILIHLINQRRFQTIRWAAMIFLLTANRMSRGYAKLRQWLIMLFRMLAIAGLIFAISRPLASGWLGLTAGGRADTTIILLDRSASMRQQSPGSVESKLKTGRQQLARTLKLLSSSRWVLIESTTNAPREIESPDALLNQPSTDPVAASADLPAMLQAAYDYLQANKSGRTEIWICSDIRQNDWNPESARWPTLRDAFLESPQGVRFHLLAYPQTAVGNLCVRVTNVRRHQGTDGAELLVSLKLTREAIEGGGQGSSETAPPIRVPLSFEIEGARSEITVEMTGPSFELRDHRIPIERSRERGWGKVSIPADANGADNEYYFVFRQPQTHQTVIVADDPQAARPLQLATSISPDPSQTCAAEVIAVDQLSTVDWDNLSLLVWQAPLPDEVAADRVQAFLDRGGQVLFLPSRAPGSASFAGMAWQNWTESPHGLTVESWRGDHDLLAHTQSGAALPVGQLQIRAHRGLSGECTPLATLKDGAPLLARVTTNRGGLYFCSTTPAPQDSSLAENGVTLYVLLQRALANGAAVLGNTRQVIAGDLASFSDEASTAWQQLAGPPDALSTEFAYQEGVYAAGEKLLAINRSPLEDQAPVLDDQRVSELFQGLDFARVDDQAGNLTALIHEIWRVFLVAMIIALITEAALCLPRRPAVPSATENQTWNSGVVRAAEAANGLRREVEASGAAAGGRV